MISFLLLLNVMLHVSLWRFQEMRNSQRI